MKSHIVSAIEAHKIIAILRGIPAEKLIPTAEALLRGGIRLLEITYDASAKISDEETANSIRTLADHFKGKLLIGAGTVMTTKQVRLTAESGGCFIISPNTDREIIKACNDFGLVSIPGALTPSEIADAHKAGADFVKLFPVTTMGPAYVKAIKAPLSHVKLLAVGGINQENMTEYLSAGVCGFGIGSDITDKTLIRNNDWDAIAQKAKAYAEVIRNG